MKYSLAPLLLLFCLSLVSCTCDRVTNSGEKTANEAFSSDLPIAKTETHNSMNSLDWEGTYKGTLPCTDCEGIETSLTLNSDLTYLLKTEYLGRNDALEEENSGSFTWDESGSIITLQNLESEQNQFKVGENLIWKLDASGNMIRGDSADHYILKKTN